MPYRLSKDRKAVEQEKNGKWVEYKRYAGRTAKRKARKLLAALKINVEDA